MNQNSLQNRIISKLVNRQKKPLRQINAQHRDKYSAKGKITGWPGGYASWGDHRVWLEPAKETNTFGRDKFSIRGGVAFGSAGCFDLRTEISDFIKWFEQNKKDVILHVKYQMII